MNLVTFTPFFSLISEDWKPLIHLFFYLILLSFLPVNKMLKSMHMVFDTEPQSATPFWQENGQWITSLGCWICLKLGICGNKINPTKLRRVWVSLPEKENEWDFLLVETRKWKWRSTLQSHFAALIRPLIERYNVEYVVPSFIDK